MKPTQKEQREEVGDLVDRILERGGQAERERRGEIGVKDGGISIRRTQFINEILYLMTPEPVMHENEAMIVMRKYDERNTESD